jgi:hypothetical protein
MLKVDLHAHTNYVIPKRDSNLSPKQLIDFAASKGYEVLAITEHASMSCLLGGIEYIDNPLRTYYDFKAYAKKKGILLIPGVETFVEGKEVLLINFTGDAKKVKTFADVEKLKRENVLVIAPHPFYKKPSCLGKKLVEHINVFDAIEHCHFYTNLINPNKKAIRIAKEYGKPLVANSDAHGFDQLNINFTLIDAKKNIDSVLDAVRKNKIRIVTNPLSLSKFLRIAAWSVMATFKKRII